LKSNEFPPEILAESPSAIVRGVPLATLPLDLYVPPAGLRVFLESFEGPLDLLLYLIQNQNIDILDIPIAEITRQYLRYIELMKEVQLDLAAEYLAMSAELTQIKSTILLPLPQEDSSTAPDPRTKLVYQLQQYARYKQAAQDLDQLMQMGRDVFAVSVDLPEIPRDIIVPSVNLSSLLSLMQDIIARASLFSSHRVLREPLSVRERMSSILARLKTKAVVDFSHLFVVEEGRAGVVVTLLAILELTKEGLLKIEQSSENAIQVTMNSPALEKIEEST
jgi:segregation and condensation protein A